jgi:hypothetical protein
VRFQIEERLILDGESLEHVDERHVLQDIAKIASVVAVLILHSWIPNPALDRRPFILRTLRSD